MEVGYISYHHLTMDTVNGVTKVTSGGAEPYHHTVDRNSYTKMNLALDE